MAERLVKRWNDWSAGIGYPTDDGQTPGMYYASGLLGLPGELRVAPFLNAVTTSIVEALSRYLFLSTANDVSHAAIELKPAAASTVAVQGSAYSGTVAANTTLTYSATVAAYTNGCLVVTVATGGISEPTGVTFNGDALTKIATGTQTNPKAITTPKK